LLPPLDTALALPVEEFILWAERLADLDWPISGEDFPAVVAKLGWGPGNFPNQLRTGIGEQSDFAIFRSNLQGLVREISLNLTETFRGDGHESMINDWFVAYFAAGKERFGEPFKTIQGGLKEAWWKRSNGAVITLVTSSFGVALEVYSPQGARYIE